MNLRLCYSQAFAGTDLLAIGVGEERLFPRILLWSPALNVGPGLNRENSGGLSLRPPVTAWRPDVLYFEIDKRSGEELLL